MTEWYSLEKVETETTAGFICCFVMEVVADWTCVINLRSLAMKAQLLENECWKIR